MVTKCFITSIEFDIFCSRYVQLPADEVDTQLLQDAARKEAQQNKQ